MEDASYAAAVIIDGRLFLCSSCELMEFGSCYLLGGRWKMVPV
jgi:hypothetical protein